MSTVKKAMAQKKPKGRGGPSAAAAGSQISDARFTKFENDPRFRLPSKHATRTKLDKRFSHVLHNKDFTETTQVDRYGRKLKSDKKKRALERLYRVDDEDDEEDDGDEEEEAASKSKSKTVQKERKQADSRSYDPARGGGFSASESDDDDDSDNDDLSDEDDEDGEDNDSEDGATSKAPDTQRFREEEAEVPTGEVTRRIAIVNLDWDHVKSRDLMAMFASFVPTGGRGRIERISVYPSEFGKERMQREELEGPPREIFKDKGDASEDDDDEDSQDEEDDDEDDEDSEDDEKVKQDLLREENDEDFDSNALRTYQLDRLRYYYAVMVCSDPATAEAIYRATDGREYQSSSNFVDLRFVPDDVSFADDEPRDECTEVPANYKPVEFVTQALQHSKVKLTWDIHPEDTSRKDMMKKAFSGTPAELIENDLRAYLASDSDGDDDDGSDDGDDGEVFEGVEDVQADGNGTEAKDGESRAGDKKPAAKLSKKELERQKMRAALGLSEEPTKSSGGSSKRGPVGGMQITFTPALSDAAASKKKKAGGDNEEPTETTIEKYKRKEKERKEMRKQKAVAKREGRDLDAEHDSDAGQGDGQAQGEAGEDLGFDDPFFFTADEPSSAGAAASVSTKSAIRKEERLKKRAAREAEDKEKEKSRAQLEALMDDGDEDKDDGAGHFDLREVMRAEKARKKEEKKKNKRNKNRRQDLEEDDGEGEGERGQAEQTEPQGLGAVMADPRFQGVFAESQFAIDPSNPRFTATPDMQEVVKNVRRKRKGGEDQAGGADAGATKAAKKAKTEVTAAPSRRDELKSLVNAVKQKSKKSSF